MGEVTSASVIRRAVATPELPEGEEQPRFSNEWKTRFEWDSGEREAIANLRQEWANKATQKQPVVAPPGAGPARKAPPPPPRPAPVAAAPRPVPAPSPAAGPPPAAVPVPVAPAAVDAAPVVKTKMPSADGPLAEVRLVGSGYDVLATAPGAYVLGRSADAPLRVKHPTVSRTHARVVISDDRKTASLEHAGGANGTRLNGRTIEKAVRLSDGDEIGIGEVSLRVVLKRS
jgi:hypothetical protein